MLHYGHLCYLRKARDLGDRLVVSVTCDKYASKGAGRPVFSEKERMEMLSHFDFIDNVMLSDTENSVPIIKTLRPAIYCKGGDYLHGDATGNLAKERAAVEACGGRLVIVTPDIVYSSTEILTGELLRKRVAALLT